MIAETPNLMYKLNVQVISYGRPTIPDRGVVSSCVHVTHYKIFGAPIISLEGLNLQSSNFAHS